MNGMDTEKIRDDFPILRRRINGKNLVYLDSAATSQKPKPVLDAMQDFYSSHNANAHRGVYKLSEEATSAYEESRGKVQRFINAKSRESIIYTSGTTQAINLVMRAYGEKFVKRSGKIVTSITEHHSNFVPWQQLADKKGAKLEVIDIDEEGKLDYEDAKKKIKGSALVAVAHASNVLGTINDVHELCSMAADSGAVSVLDAAQSAPHMNVDVKKISCDFLAFSGHKMFASTGIGILYGKEELLGGMDPFLYGGEMIQSVTVKKSEWNSLPYKFEAGTQPVGEAISLGAAIDYINKIGIENIAAHGTKLVRYALGKLGEIPNLEIYGPQNPKERVPLVSFNIKGIHAHDVATILDEFGISIRSGHHCAMPLHDKLGIAASARASFGIYNTKKEIDLLCGALEEAKKIFKV